MGGAAVVGNYTKRLSRTAKLQDEQDARAFPAKNPCHDCAFRPGSPEREDPTAWARLKRQAQVGHPFYCHFKHDGTEMPRDEAGKYVPDCREDGAPIGYPLCRGWVAFMDGLRDKEPLPEVQHVSRVVALRCDTCQADTDHSFNGRTVICRYCNTVHEVPA